MPKGVYKRTQYHSNMISAAKLGKFNTPYVRHGFLEVNEFEVAKHIYWDFLKRNKLSPLSIEVPKDSIDRNYFLQYREYLFQPYTHI